MKMSVYIDPLYTRNNITRSQMEGRKEKESKTIRISKENYDKIVELGDMTKSFNDVFDEIMKQASSAGAALNRKEEK